MIKNSDLYNERMFSMSKVAVVYWSGTGNTEAMASFVQEGAKEAGAEVSVFTSSEFNATMLSEYSGIAFGCPCMGQEVLEESEFEPMWDEVKDKLEGKKIVLFGSYGWGDGEWMRNWKTEAPCTIIDTYICNEAPDTEAEQACKNLGKIIA